jgi:hypothetical protein
VPYLPFGSPTPSVVGRGTAAVVDQLRVTKLNFEVAPGLYVALVACLAPLAFWRWPETAFEPAL